MQVCPKLHIRGFTWTSKQHRDESLASIFQKGQLRHREGLMSQLAGVRMGTQASWPLAPTPTLSSQCLPTGRLRYKHVTPRGLHDPRTPRAWSLWQGPRRTERRLVTGPAGPAAESPVPTAISCPLTYHVRLGFPQAAIKTKIHLTVFMRLCRNISYMWHAIIMFFKIYFY